ncbi:hypothetical protein KO504_17135, partial [Winogradskyella psychrotolerans]|nr:hypothetical protein [Winogradskyella psychrotolerans]
MKKILLLLISIVLFFEVQAQEPNDCVNAIVVCGNETFMSNATGIGNTQEVSGCGGFENNSIWLEVNIAQSGTLGFDLIPDDPDIMVDYDFWVFGPNRSCEDLGSPIRCATTNPNQAGLSNNHTGINGSTTLTQSGPGASGNSYVYWLNVTVGESYFIVIDRPTGDGGFQLEWTGTANEGSGAFPAPPETNDIEDVKQCSSNPDVAVFDLNSIKSSINPDSGVVIDFYESLADATDDVNELPGIYANTANPQQIYAKVKSGITGCYSLIDFNLVVTPIPDATIAVSNTDICLGEEVTFTITGTPDAVIHYNINGGTTEEVLLDATGTATLVQSPMLNTEVNLEDAQILTATNTVVCSQALTDSTSVTIQTNTTPTIINNSPICENENGELQLSGDPNAIITYTVDSGAPQTLNLGATGNFTLTIPNLTADTDIEIISVTRDLLPNCELVLNITETIVVNPFPDYSVLGFLYKCNDGVNPNTASFDLDAVSAGIIDGPIPNLTITYFETQALSINGDPTDALVSTYNSTSANQTVYVRLETDLGCVMFSTLQLNVIETPIANTPPDLQTCAFNNSGIGIFDLTEVEAEVIAGNTQGVQVSYYVLEVEAEAGIPSITNPTTFENTDAYNQTIYVRVDSDATDCYSIAPLNLEVFDNPTITTPDNLETCDDVSNDGLAQFNLENQTAIILNGATGITVTYHLSQLDAENNDDAITSLYTNESNNQTIYVRAENDLNTSCFTTITFDLVVNPLPVLIAPSALEVCDDGIPDGLTEIDLSLKNTEITGNNPIYSVSYYLTQLDADSETNPLPTLYTNTSNGQIIFVRVEDTNTGCYDTTTLELIVEQAPIAFTPQALRYCDPDNDGFGLFNLTSVNNEITGGAPGLTVTYHETEINADNGVDAIDTTVNYNNIVQDAQTLYVRVESATIATDCATIVELDLIVEPTPQLVAPTPLEVCDDISADGFASFDLTTKANEILNGQDPTQYIVSYYESEANASTGLNPIANPLAYTNTDDFNQIIWVRVEDNTTVEGCYKLIALELIVNALPVLVTPAPLELCDVNNPGDEQEAFILEEANAEILNGQTGITLTHYETQLDAANGTNPIVSPYTNLSNAQTIFVRAQNDITGCYNTVTVTLRVNPIPSPETSPEPIEVCDEDNDGFAEFDLEIRTVEITNGESDVVITYHETQTDAEMGDNPITGLYTNIVANNQIIYVRSENTITGCYSLTENTLELIVHPAPEVPIDIAPYIICDSDNDGLAQFDLTTKDAEILNGQDPTAVVLTYHVSAVNAEDGSNPIINVGNYTNNGNPQVIYVRLYDPITECFDTGMFELNVALPPEAIQPTQLNACDDLGEVPGDEITEFDLTLKDAEITGGNASWSVAYY